MEYTQILSEEAQFRTVTKFILFPKTINGITKWLTKASYLEKIVYDNITKNVFTEAISWN